MPFSSSPALRRDDRVDPLGPAQIVELRQTASAVKDKIVLQRMFRTGMCFSVTSGRLPSVRPTAKQTHETLIDLRRREPMEMTVIPVQPLRHVPRDVVGVGVRHPRRDVQHDIVGISLRADVRAMGVEIYR